MARVLVTTIPNDVHAAAVACALERRGHEAVMLYGSDLPTRMTASVHIDGDRDPSIFIDDRSVGQLDSVWLRRPSRAVLPDDLHPSDRPAATRELEDFTTGFYDLLGPRAFWVNPIHSGRRANSKLLQLREAHAAGLATPHTLVSTDPARIRAFVRGHGGDVIYKPLQPSVWDGVAGRVSTMTTIVTEDMLPDDDVLRLVPGIFQPLIQKRHELRVTVIGDHVVTARIRSQDASATRIDWRADGGCPPVELDTLPHGVEARCRDVMHRLGLVFGCFDLIVTPDGEHVFLEVNQMGQWLWIERALPETWLLDRFTALLAQGRPDFEWPHGERIAYAEVLPEAMAIVERAAATHVVPRNRRVVGESSDNAPSPLDPREVGSQPLESSV